MNDFIRSSALIVLFFAGIICAADDCPKPCSCKPNGVVDCRGKKLPSIPSLPATSESVDLSNNEISEIHETDFRNLTELKSLNLTSNLIKNVSSTSFHNCKVLSHLYMGNNHLTQVPTLKVKSLELVDFSGNGINENPFEVFDKSWSECKNLTAINLARNKFRHFPSTTFSNLKGLPVKNINLSSNLELTAIDPSLFQHVGANLEILDLSSDSLTLTSLSAALQYGEALTNLYVHGNKLGTLDDAVFGKLVHLETLSLSGNGLTTWTGNAFSHFKLKTLDLSNNRIETIRNSSADNSISHILKTLKTVKLGGNPYACYCSLVWLRTWIDSESIKVTDKSKMTCDKPIAMKGKSFLTLFAKNCTTERTTTVAPSTTTHTLPPTTTEHNASTTTAPTTTTAKITTTLINITTTSHVTTTHPYVTTTAGNSTIKPTPQNMTTTEPVSTTSHPIAPTTKPDDHKKHGFPWWGILLILLLLAAVAGAAYLLYKRWRRRRLLDEGRLPIIGDQTA